MEHKLNDYASGVGFDRNNESLSVFFSERQRRPGSGASDPELDHASSRFIAKMSSTDEARHALNPILSLTTPGL